MIVIKYKIGVKMIIIFYTQYLVSLMLCTMVVASRTSNLVAEGGLFFTMATCEIIFRCLYVVLKKEKNK